MHTMKQLTKCCMVLFILSIHQWETNADVDDVGIQMDPNSEANKAHLKDDLSGIIDKKPEDMTVQELQFHYFRQHDYDKDEFLDGNELVRSYLESNNAENAPFKNELELIDHVDQLISRFDKNDDGLIDVAEYKLNV